MPLLTHNTILQQMQMMPAASPAQVRTEASKGSPSGCATKRRISQFIIVHAPPCNIESTVYPHALPRFRPDCNEIQTQHRDIK